MGMVTNIDLTPQKMPLEELRNVTCQTPPEVKKTPYVLILIAVLV
jgi:hypothetical protein